MKRIITCLLSILSSFSLFGQSSYYQQTTWRLCEGALIPANSPRGNVIPEKETVFFLSSSLEAQLFSIAQRSGEQDVITLPTPDGTMRTFLVKDHPVMETPLALKYPMIRTFSGVCTDDPSTTVALDYTVFGLHAMVTNGKQTYFIDPYSPGNNDYYSCFKKDDFPSSVAINFSCLVDDIGATQHALNDKKSAPQKVSGSVLYTFRLALACTGEYAVTVAGSNPTKAAVLSQMVTTLNRVNQVYEREVSVHLNLVAQNDTLIFLDGTTDPYSNNSSGQMLQQNQNTVDSLIGTLNYDIGHVFGTGSGGVAQLGSVCSNGIKAKGVTGLSSPFGDPFAIDYVSHEMGHQFNANHTFNAATGSCSGNGVSSEAYEPGSGTTIMSYAGICGSGNDFQPHSDAYFHAVSLIKINNFLSGLSCAQTSLSNNVPPVVPPFTQSYSIPASTPFELTAPQAIDFDHDTLTYCWQQWNLGNYKTSWSAPSSRGPIFRSFPPDTGRTRVFPALAKVLSGVLSYPGEKLPTNSRFLTFKLTVRDIYNGSGSFNIPDDTVHLDVTDQAGPFEVLSPGVGIAWLGNSAQTVTWNVANTDLPPVNCQTVDIYLSLDGGYTFPYVLATATPNDGSETVNVPNVVSTNQARVKVKGSNNVFFNISRPNFSITHTSGLQQLSWEKDVHIFPVPAHTLLQITSENYIRYRVRINNALGQQLYEGQFSRSLQISVSDWAKGIYYLQLANANTGEAMMRPVIIH